MMDPYKGTFMKKQLIRLGVARYNAARITSLGNVEIQPITEEQKKNIKNNKISKTRKFIIETNDGRFEVELLVDEDGD